MTGQKPEVVVLTGLPGAGKSSFYRTYFAHSHLLISKDLMKKRKNKEAHQAKLLRDALFQSRPIVIDNTNLNRDARHRIIQTAHHFGVKCVLYYFPLTVKESMERNLGPYRSQVPPVAIYSAQKRLQLPEPAEGFDEVFEVRMLGPSEFRVNLYLHNDHQAILNL